MIADTLNYFSITDNSTTTDIANGYYAPVMKFGKYNTVSIGKKCEFIVDVFELGNTTIMQNRLYIASYDNGSVSKLSFYELKNSELNCFIEDTDEYYILYVKPSVYGTSIITQVAFCRNINYAEPIFEGFTKDVSTVTNPIRPTGFREISLLNNKTTQNVYSTKPINSSAEKYIKIGSIYTPNNYQGNTVSIDIEEKQNGNSNFIAGRVYIKTRGGESSCYATIRLGGATEDFRIENINVVGVRPESDSSKIDLYLKLEKTYTSFLFKPNIYNIGSGYNAISFLDNQTSISKLPSGTLYTLFEPTTDNPLEQEETN